MHKKGIRIGLVLAGMVLLGFLSACCSLGLFCPRPQQLFTVTITLGAGDTPIISPDTVKVYTLDFVEWTNNFNGPLRIHLNDSFATPYNLTIAPGDTGRVMVRGGTTLGVYKYDVSFEHDDVPYSVDPWFDVEEEGDGDRGPGGDDF